MATSGFTSAASAARSAINNIKTIGAPLVQSLPGSGNAASGALYTMANYAQQMQAPAEDVAAYTIAAGTLSAAATGVAQGGQAVVAAASNPATLLGAADLALAYGVGKEAVAAYQGKCR